MKGDYLVIHHRKQNYIELLTMPNIPSLSMLWNVVHFLYIENPLVINKNCLDVLCINIFNLIVVC